MNTSRRDFLAAGVALPAAGSLQSPSSKPAIRLQTRTLGKTGLKVNQISFGCMITSDASVIERAADIGIIHFDTARVYQGGNNERMVGAALKSKRKNLVLSSKSKGATTQECLTHLETSLKELQTDYLDIWYLHDKRAASDIKDELLEAQRIAKKQGKIRFAGISNHAGHEDLLPAVVKHKNHFDVLLTSYNFAMGTSADRYIEAVHKAGIGVVAMKVMAGGFRKAAFYPSDDKTRSILGKPGAMAAALKWVMKAPFIDTQIPSMVDMDQLDENLLAVSTPYTSTDEKTLSAQLDFIRPLYCRMCGQCNGQCPQGVPVQDTLRFLMYAEGYGQFSLARTNYLEMPEQARNVRCGECTGCTIQCPNGVKVQQRLIRAQELLA